MNKKELAKKYSKSLYGDEYKLGMDELKNLHDLMDDCFKMGYQEALKKVLDMKREAIQEQEAVSPMGIVSRVYGDNLPPPSPEWNVRKLLYVKVFDIENLLGKNN